LASSGDRNSSVTARSTEKTEGTRLRSSSVKGRPGLATSSEISRPVRSPIVTSASVATALPMAGSSASPRRFSASIFTARPRAEITRGGSMMAVSQRV